MAEIFSIVAGAVGVIDVVLRTSTFCYRFLSDVKDAPREIKLLQASIKENEQLVYIFKGYLKDVRDRRPPTSASGTELTSALGHCHSSVKGLQRELDSLSKLIKRHSNSDNMWRSFRYILDEKKMNKSLEKLKELKSMMTTGLLLVERYRSATGQDRIENAIQHNFQQLTSTIHTQSLKVSMSQNQQKRLLANSKITVQLSAKHLITAREIQTDILQTSRTQRIEHRKTRERISRDNRKTIEIITSKIERLSYGTAETTTAAKTSHRKIHFYGKSRESMLTPLLLMKEQVRRAVVRALSGPGSDVSPEHLCWLKVEFENLVDSATQETAALARGSTATSIDQWTYFTGFGSARKKVATGGADSAGEGHDVNDVEGQALVGSTRRTGAGPLFCQDHKALSFESPVGKLGLVIAAVWSLADTIYDIDEAALSFIPAVGINSTSIRARLFNSTNSMSNPRLGAQLNVFRVLDAAHLAHRPRLILGLGASLGISGTAILFYGRLKDIDAAFRAGVISPYDQVRIGFGRNVCLWMAGATRRPEILTYMDSEGIGPQALKGEIDSLHGLWSSLQETGYHEFKIFPMLEYFDEILTDDVFTRLDSYRLLHLTKSVANAHYTEEDLDRIQEWMEFLNRHHYDFEVPDPWGNTPLLYNLKQTGRASLAMVCLLLKVGVNVHALNKGNCNAIHLAMWSIPENFELETKSYRTVVASSVEYKLSILVQAGVDLHHRDQYGNTPSHTARCLSGQCSEWIGFTSIGSGWPEPSGHMDF